MTDLRDVRPESSSWTNCKSHYCSNCYHQQRHNRGQSDLLRCPRCLRDCYDTWKEKQTEPLPWCECRLLYILRAAVAQVTPLCSQIRRSVKYVTNSRMASSGMLRRVVLVRTYVSEELGASFIRMTRFGELGTTLAVTSNWRTLRRNTKYFFAACVGF
jgi:hypothetical protein